MPPSQRVAFWHLDLDSKNTRCSWRTMDEAKLLLKHGSLKFPASQRTEAVHGRLDLPIEAASPLNTITVRRELCLYHDDGAERSSYPGRVLPVRK